MAGQRQLTWRWWKMLFVICHKAPSWSCEADAGALQAAFLARPDSKTQKGEKAHGRRGCEPLLCLILKTKVTQRSFSRLLFSRCKVPGYEEHYIFNFITGGFYERGERAQPEGPEAPLSPKPQAPNFNAASGCDVLSISVSTQLYTRNTLYVHIYIYMHMYMYMYMCMCMCMSMYMYMYMYIPHPLEVDSPGGGGTMYMYMYMYMYTIPVCMHCMYGCNVMRCKGTERIAM